MPATPNNTTNVSVGGGVRGGYLFSAPLTAKMPTDYETTLDENFVNLGYVTSDGAVMSDTTESTAFTDLNGDTIANANSSESHTFAFTLAEVRKDSLAEQYGHRNVKDADGMITIEGKSNGFESRIYVAELVFRDGRRGRFVVPNGEHQSTGDLTVNSTTLYSRQVTVLGMPDESGASFYYYIESTETEKS